MLYLIFKSFLGESIMVQQLLTEGKLLDSSGRLQQAGYNTQLVREYNRKDIKSSSFRIKEWDYYYIGNEKYGVALTIADNSYMSLISVSFMDFTQKTYKTTNHIDFFTFGKLNMPSSFNNGDIHFDNKRVQIDFLNLGDKRALACNFKKFKNNKDFVCTFELFDFPQDNMVIATPFPKKSTAFYYNAKINCMRAKGSVYIGGKGYFFDDNDTLATLDWGRGVWTYKNTWYWSSMNTIIDNVRVGFNLGYGFGDNSKATENMIFVDGIAHKTEKVNFNIPINKNGKKDFLSTWTFESTDNRINLTFSPLLDRIDNTNAIIISTKQHQVFGLFNGTLTLDNGNIIKLRNALGFAEKVTNRW